MRLLRLELEKYGAFEGRVLTFRPEARLHVVYGPNEAGKSSALSAVGDLLFGFGARTDYAFRHAMGDLRLGAEIAGDDGTRLTFRRRKGNKATLIDAGEAPLGDGLLAPYLGQLTRETFERAFGLGPEAMRKGAEDLLSAQGESGASLFAAASGLRGVQELRRSLDDQADSLFSPQARARPFNDLFKRHEAARTAQRENELGATQWKRLNDEIESLEERHRAFEDARAKARTDRTRLERLSRGHGAAVELEQARRAFEVFSDAPELAAERAAEITERLETAAEADKARVRAAEALRLAEEALAGVTLDTPAVAAAADIERLFRDSGAFAAAQKDLPRVRREADGLDEQLARLAVRLGLADARAVETALPTDAARAALAELIDEGRRLAHADDTCEKALAAEHDQLVLLRERQGEAPPLDPGGLRSALALVGPRARALERQAELAAEHEREARALADAAARMSPPVGDLGRLAARPLPSPEWIQRARKEQADAAAAVERAEEEGARAEVEEARVATELDRLAAAGPIASPETIRAARDDRDARWASLRGQLLGEGPRMEAGGVAAFEHTVAEADRLADRLAEDAGRAARQADLLVRKAEIARERDRLASTLVERRARQNELLDAWTAGWETAGVRPGAPDEMEAWRKELLALFARREQNAVREAALARLDAEASALAPELARLAASAGVERAEGVPAPALVVRIEEAVEALAKRWQEVSALSALIAESERRLKDLERGRDAAGNKRETWRGRWAAALPAFGLAEDAPIVSADAALAAWTEAPALIDRRSTLLQRVRGMDRDAGAFRGEVEALVEAFGTDLADLPPEAAADRLNRRLTSARASGARRDDAVLRRDAARAAEASAVRTAEAEQAALRAAAADLPPDADIRALLPRAAERARLKGVVEDRRDQLLRLGGASDEPTLLAELENFQPDASPAEIERLKDEESRIDGDAQQAWAELHADRAKRDALGGAAAEHAAADGRAAGAALYAMAREWSVAKLASLLLGAAIERARASDRSPTLERAGALFATLTGEAFSGFAEDYEDDALVLFGRRASGETVPIRGMSEGTRDQFYLALRLAALEDYAVRAEPAPFIGDDLFATFDDARTAHGLQALADVGARVQPILFTHHRAVVESARKTLGEAVDVVEIDPLTR